MDENGHLEAVFAVFAYLRNHKDQIMLFSRPYGRSGDHHDSAIESSTFGAKFVALWVCTETLIALRYKLQSFGIGIVGPTDVYCDNGSVFKSASVVEERLNKKHLVICYHRVRECCATVRRASLLQCVLWHFRHHS
jgi:hypothetical protein